MLRDVNVSSCTEEGAVGRTPWPSWALVLIAAAPLLMVCCFASAASAESFLAVRIIGGQGHSYPLSQIEEITTDSGVLAVVTAAGADHYPMNSIAQIEFVTDGWTGIDGPESAADAVRTFHLFASRPNPFSPETHIAYELPQPGWTELRIYSVSGRLVRTLVEGGRAAGRHSAVWDGLDDSGRAVASGVYLYALVAPGVQEGRKMLLIR
jgi:hypothetical protein